MGQEQTIKMVMDLKFTTLKELTPLLEKDMNQQAIGKALSRLVKHGEVVSFRLIKEQIYMDKDFYDELIK